MDYEMLSKEQRLQQIDARLFGVEQELFNAQLNVEMEQVIEDEAGGRASLIAQNIQAVEHATKRLARLRELRAELAAPVPAPRGKSEGAPD